jgi:hypothetical protein
MTTINIDFKPDVITHALEIENKIVFIRQIRDATNCSLRDAKDAAEKISKIITDLVPATNVVRSQITRVLSDHDKNNPENLKFLQDVLQFMQTTKPDNLKAHNISVPEYHSCGDECRHKCQHIGCDSMISYHDEPYCFTHSPDSGSSVPGYDSRTPF